jgi:hypothetical protein
LILQLTVKRLPHCAFRRPSSEVSTGTQAVRSRGRGHIAGHSLIPFASLGDDPGDLVAGSALGYPAGVIVPARHRVNITVHDVHAP